MNRLVVFRFSAMGDVVLLLPVLVGLLSTNKELEVYLVTRRSFFPFFQKIDRLHLIEADFKGAHKGFTGLYKLFRYIKRVVNPDQVVDVHSVLRTIALFFFFKLSGVKTIRFNKGRKEKKAILQTKNIKPLPTTVERYASAFYKLGYNFDFPETPVFKNIVSIDLSLLNVEKILIGISPFAKHPQKVWGTDKIEEFIALINRHYKTTFILFGGGQDETIMLNNMAQKYNNCIVAANFFGLEEEISLFHHLSAMISMDSANMHMAAMAGIPTISVWGATHPAFRFTGYKQPAENIIQYEGDKIKCRPCSVFGNKPCIYPEIKCMKLISPEDVFKRLNTILSKV